MKFSLDTFLILLHGFNARLVTEPVSYHRCKSGCHLISFSSIPVVLNSKGK